ncbi:hypothetical protein [Bifidobacterium imperatoris]|uniref:hypothetical protein n=1 Tax=Bifidobacterium imperatoris TaxID=2020965 RepID=UPI0013FD5E1C|nr:hypothetical protein [Bifidobacterium imperatoris]
MARTDISPINGKDWQFLGEKHAAACGKEWQKLAKLRKTWMAKNGKQSRAPMVSHVIRHSTAKKL